MSEHIINSEWSELSEDDGTVTLDYNEYDIIIGGEQADEIVSTPTNISYSPSINKAKNITVDVPPDSNLEDLTYLGDQLELYIDGRFAFGGEIIEIETQQKEGEDYSITARPPGKKLSGADYEKTANNEIFVDIISTLVDEFNTFDNQHDSMINTSEETRNNIVDLGGNVLGTSGGSGSVTYSPVGPDLSDITSIYVKAYTEVSDGLDLTVSSTSSSTSETVTISDIFDKNDYGQWERFTFDFGSTDEYELEFSLSSDTRLIDWISVTNEDVYRETTSPDVEILEENIDFYTRSGDELENTAEEVGDGILFDGNGRPQTRQITDWATSPFPLFGGDDYVNGEGGNIMTGDQPVEWDFSPSDPMEDWALYARTFSYEIFVNRNETHTQGNTNYDESWSGNASVSTDQVAVEDSSVYIAGDADKNFQWTYNRDDAIDPLEFESQAYIPSSGTINWNIVQSDDGYGLKVGSSSIELVRIDDGLDETLDSVDSGPQTGEWFDWTIEIEDNSDNVSATLTDSSGSYSLSANDETYSSFEQFQVDTNTSHYLDDMFAEVGDVREIDLKVTVDGSSLSVGLLLPDVDYREWGWTDLATYDFIGDYPNPIDSNIEVSIGPGEVSDDSNSTFNPTAFVISPLVLVHKESEWSGLDFDLTVDEAEGHLDYPPEYADGTKFGTDIRFTEEISDENIAESTVESTVNTEQDIISSWGPSQVIDLETTSFPSYPDSTTSTNSYSYPGVQHVLRYSLSSGGFRDNDSPREGFNRQRLDSFSVDYSVNNLEVMFDRSLSNNHLALMNSLAEDSSVLFRWEGEKAKIFHRGQETTDIDLRSENISSSVSIEDVYGSCEVIGLHNVRSGIIESSDAPDFVDDHKVIRTEDITDVTDAKNRARRFLENHGSIQFKGDISTLPTFAPLGAEIDGSLFNHGQDMIIQGVRYNKRGATISLGYNKNVSTELLALGDDTQSTKSRTTSKGMTIPAGEEQI